MVLTIKVGHGSVKHKINLSWWAKFLLWYINYTVVLNAMILHSACINEQFNGHKSLYQWGSCLSLMYYR